ncbi:hypothetical protein AVEN_189374-1 [Araneus ventricosus]|uniref:Tc1-like transposase DDE domain-containing protein n=1 Tax=Araneus ventricosus TaxID=182803 RepID=A0A4Y2UF63_ARAVE|nr:hypothetical protein AVEN_189374-1 [Araneus ventricosus]
MREKVNYKVVQHHRFKDLLLSDLWNVWFQHDGTPLHKVSNIQQYTRDTFQQQVIGYGGCIEWPPRSPDLNPLDFFLWGMPQTASVCNPSANIAGTSKPYYGCLCQRVTSMLYNVQREVQSRVQMCIVAEECHFEHYR